MTYKEFSRNLERVPLSGVRVRVQKCVNHIYNFTCEFPLVSLELISGLDPDLAVHVNGVLHVEKGLIVSVNEPEFVIDCVNGATTRHPGQCLEEQIYDRLYEEFVPCGGLRR